MSPEQSKPKSDVHRVLGQEYGRFCKEFELTASERGVLDKVFPRLDKKGLKADDKTLIFLEELRDGLGVDTNIRKKILISAFSRINQEYADRNPFNPSGKRGRKARNN